MRLLAMDQSDDQTILNAEGLLALIERHLPALWQAHARSGNHSLRLVLRRAETLLVTRASNREEISPKIPEDMNTPSASATRLCYTMPDRYADAHSAIRGAPPTAEQLAQLET